MTTILYGFKINWMLAESKGKNMQKKLQGQLYDILGGKEQLK